MDGRLFMELLAVVALVMANGFFALAEFSVIASRPSRLRSDQEEGKRGAAAAEKMRANPERFLASIQVGITLVGATLGVFSGAIIVGELEALFASSSVAVLAESARTVSMLTMVILITILSVVIGELVPKFMALAHPERFARFLSAPIGLFIKITAPFSRLLSMLAAMIVRMLGLRKDASQHQITEEEINQIIIEGRRRGVFEATEQQFVRSVFEFTDSTVRRAMKPRTDVVGIELGTSADEIMNIIVENGYSRYPIFEKTIDRVVGILYTKDLIDKESSVSRINLSALLREPVFVPDSMPLPKVLREFQKGKAHMAVVLDEFGGTAGIITLEDVIEELVGEIQDEYDTEAAPIIRHSDTIVYAAGDVWPGDINEVLNTHLPEDSYDTLAGLYIETVGHLPSKNETTTIADTRLTILAKDENRILRLKLEKIIKGPHLE